MLAYYNRAKNHYRIENTDSALIDINKAYALATVNSYKIDSMNININIHVQSIYDDKYNVPILDILFERGLIFLKMDSLDKAYIDINNCISNEELSAQAHYWRGIINQKIGDVKAACQDLNIALDYGVEDAQIEIDKYCRDQDYER